MRKIVEHLKKYTLAKRLWVLVLSVTTLIVIQGLSIVLDVNQIILVSIYIVELILFGLSVSAIKKLIAENKKQFQHNEIKNELSKKAGQLEQSNLSLNLLYKIAKMISVQQSSVVDYQTILQDLTKTLNVQAMEICLLKSEGSQAYEHVQVGEYIDSKQCATLDCDGCIKAGHQHFEKEALVKTQYPLQDSQENFGVLTCTHKQNQPLKPWQNQLLFSVAELFTTSITLNEKRDSNRVLALMTERAVIARELHDSLAQSLSYLNIQATRLNRAQQAKVNDQAKQEIIDEIKEGLSNAYRQLRELLSTFRLKIEHNGIKAALEETVKHLQAKVDINVELNFKIEHIPLTPHEEIHLVQLAREAAQNACYHSNGQNINIDLYCELPDKIFLTVKDDGVGISDDPEKLNHYGLAIMKERSRNLNGELIIKRRESKGTVVKFSFEPTELKTTQKINLQEIIHHE
ncbi:histidine kinase [Marinicellulosiphila megalodicopiae]|uniref:histidine kinase n=1 Tax=Marinicellulosiphila megalodicopiae TaxID=2724896 RepID=UPI003BB1051D